MGNWGFLERGVVDFGECKEGRGWGLLGSPPIPHPLECCAARSIVHSTAFVILENEI